MIELCVLCNQEPISALKRPLCWRCYGRCRNTKTLHLFPLTDVHTVENAVIKYGEGIKQDMERLHKGETTLHAVGEKYGVSRERIRQLYEPFAGEKYTYAVVGRMNKRKEKEANIRKGLSTIESRMNRAKKHCTHYIGIIAEYLFYEKCKSMGYDVAMKTGLYDATVNGINVDIKSATEAHSRSRCGTPLYYYFHSNQKQRDAVQFFPFYLFDQNVWYIIPSGELTSGGYYIPKYDTRYNNFHKYKDVQKYREAWHLLI